MVLRLIAKKIHLPVRSAAVVRHPAVLRVVGLEGLAVALAAVVLAAQAEQVVAVVCLRFHQ
jgi:hypothetical protein